MGSPKLLQVEATANKKNNYIMEENQEQTRTGDPLYEDNGGGYGKPANN